MGDSERSQLALGFDSVASEDDFSSESVGNSENREDSSSEAGTSFDRARPSSRARGESSPMLAHYREVKAKYPEHVLLFQVGDFYEIFFDDATIVANCLKIRLTSRNKEDDNPIPMCGVPIHAIDTYLPRLLAGGLSCVLVSQVEDGGDKKNVRREISRIITPGLRYLGDGLEESAYNFLAAAVVSPRGNGALVYVDVSTGDFRVQEAESVDSLIDILERVRPAELILPSTYASVAVDRRGGWFAAVRRRIEDLGCHLVLRPFDSATRQGIEQRLTPLLSARISAVQTKAFLELLSPEALSAAQILIQYVRDMSCDSIPKISDLRLEEEQTQVTIDAATRRNLELVETRIDRDRKNSLLGRINYTRTAMGSRLFADWILSPSADMSEIKKRHECVGEFVAQPLVVSELRELFLSVRDLDRLLSRIDSSRANPRDLSMLLGSLQILPRVKEILDQRTSVFLSELSKQFDILTDISARLATTLTDEPATKTTEGGIIRNGFHPEVDRLRKIATDSQSLLAQMEKEERERSNIPVLKVKYNNVFGYFIEVTKTHLAKVPEDYERRQTLVNVERFVTKRLKHLETEILSAKGRLVELERELFNELRNWVCSQIDRVRLVSRLLSVLDVLSSFAHLAIEHDYVRPEMSEDLTIDVSRGRHPVVECVIGRHNFTPNEILLDVRKRRFAVLTGPNMGGKSTYLRQVALIQLLAQAGSFVPAARAKLGIVDRIFTRIGAADDLSRGDSTFMVEMRETASILRKATRRSLVLIDEIGRGTATADGLALARAVSEWLHDRIGCQTIFATHFHELTELPIGREGMFCLAVGVEEKDDEILFTHHIAEGAADRSYGIEVARLAGLPETLLTRARELMDAEPLSASHNAQKRKAVSGRPSIEVPRKEDHSVARLKQRVLSYNVNTITPIQALQELVELQHCVSSEDNT